MKIGILTFHRAENFGATVQVLALQEFLTANNHAVEIIDYRCKAIEKWYSLTDLTFFFKRKNVFVSLKIFIDRLLTLALRLKQKQKFNDFWNKHLKISKEVFGKVESISKYDICICGSDQIWNPYVTAGFDPMYFLKFTMPAGAKKIAYAASSEGSHYPIFKEKEAIIRNYFHDFNAISVRESSLSQELQQYTEKKIEVVVDPTLLQEKEFYKRILVDPRRRSFVLVYHLYESDLATEVAKQIAEKEGLDVIHIHAGFLPFLKSSDTHIQDASPSEILGYINYADYVVTTSFHGTVLSVILEKNFYVIDKGHNQRQRDFLSLAGLESRFISTSENLLIEEINYSSVANKLYPSIRDSKRFLLDNISN